MPAAPVPLSDEQTKDLIEKKLKESDWGLCLIASDIATLKKYPYLNDMPCDLFYPSSRNVGNTLLACPLPCADLSGYDTVVYLDTPLGFSLHFPRRKLRIIIKTKTAEARSAIFP